MPISIGLTGASVAARQTSGMAGLVHMMGSIFSRIQKENRSIGSPCSLGFSFYSCFWRDLARTSLPAKLAAPPLLKFHRHEMAESEGHQIGFHAVMNTRLGIGSKTLIFIKQEKRELELYHGYQSRGMGCGCREFRAWPGLSLPTRSHQTLVGLGCQQRGPEGPRSNDGRALKAQDGPSPCEPANDDAVMASTLLCQVGPKNRLLTKHVRDQIVPNSQPGTLCWLT